MTRFVKRHLNSCQIFVRRGKCRTKTAWILSTISETLPGHAIRIQVRQHFVRLIQGSHRIEVHVTFFIEHFAYKTQSVGSAAGLDAFTTNIFGLEIRSAPFALILISPLIIPFNCVISLAAWLQLPPLFTESQILYPTFYILYPRFARFKMCGISPVHS